jgi:hypothetical protein
MDFVLPEIEMAKSDKRTRRKHRTKKRKTRRKYSMEYVIAEFAGDSSGGGYSRSYTVRAPQHRNRIHQLIQLFVQYGWDSDFIQSKFANADDTMLRDYTYAQWIEGLTQNWLRVAGYKSSISESLIGIGFRVSAANTLESILLPFIGSSYDEEQIILTGISYLLGTYKELAPYAEFLHNPDIQQKCYPLEKIQGFNIPFKCNSKSFARIENLLSAFPILTGYRRFYHATNWDSAEKIQRRIQHGKGRKHTDFGANPAFYVSPNLIDPIKWIECHTHIWKSENAILLFDIPDMIPDSRIRKKDLNEMEWSSVVQFARNPKNDEDAPEIEEYDLVYGPMLANTNDVRNGSIPQKHNPIKYQLASKSDAGDKFLQSCLVGCVYFKKI